MRMKCNEQAGRVRQNSRRGLPCTQNLSSTSGASAGATGCLSRGASQRNRRPAVHEPARQPCLTKWGGAQQVSPGGTLRGSVQQRSCVVACCHAPAKPACLPEARRSLIHCSVLQAETGGWHCWARAVVQPRAGIQAGPETWRSCSHKQWAPLSVVYITWVWEHYLGAMTGIHQFFDLGAFTGSLTGSLKLKLMSRKGRKPRTS